MRDRRAADVAALPPFRGGVPAVRVDDGSSVKLTTRAQGGAPGHPAKASAVGSRRQGSDR